MRGPGLALAVLAASCTLSACKPRPAQSWGFSDLDCRLGYAGLKAQIAAKPGVRPAPFEKAHLTSYQSDPELRLYVVTEPGHPAHPSVIMTSIGPTVEGLRFSVGGCGYGDASETRKLIDAYQLYGRAVQGDYPNSMAGNQRLSPAAAAESSAPPPP